MAVFFTTRLPQFTPVGASFTTPLALGLLFCVLTLAWLALYAFVVGQASQVFGRPAARRVLDAVTGTVLVALGFRLLGEGSKTG
jgi:threonine/homoserine/homoserine lactone efflux protein